jgi:two-component system, sporulation sensor kinase A
MDLCLILNCDIVKEEASMEKRNQPVSGDKSYTRSMAQSPPTKKGKGKSDYISEKGFDHADQHILEALEKSIKELKDIKFALDQSAIVAITDQKGIIHYANDKFCEISKYSREELLGQDHRIINSKYHPKEFIRNLWTTIASGHVWRGEIRNRAKDGSLYWVDTTIVPLLSEDGKPYQYVAIRYDITGRKQMEQELEQRTQQLQLFEEKLREAEKLMIIGMLSSEIAHEVGTPLNIISGRVELIAEREKANERTQKDIQVINQQIDRIAKIIRERLEITRKKKGRSESINLHQLFSGLIEFLSGQSQKTDIHLDVKLPSDLSLQGDEDQLQQVFLNILINAMQSMNQHGKIIIRSNLHRQDEVDFIDIQIQDKGMGIPSENLQKIFDPFFSTKKDRGGTGLGLSVAKEIVKQHGGNIIVESEVNQGSTFHILLPLNVHASK